ENHATERCWSADSRFAWLCSRRERVIRGGLKDKLMIIELPGFDFEKPRQDAVAIEPLLDKVRQFLEPKRVDKNEYIIGSQIAPGLGELVIKKVNDFWLIYTTERGTNFDVAIFSNEFHAVNYFVFQLTGEKETIDWSTI
ncbi:hypothetical protein ABIB38_003783, partial [Massilia sp. UYP11]|uniref:hypothetical protein n=1 Tax=Massilia sp. UYP11 TaxID=1756385 RepID=UPI003D1FC8A7